MKNKKKNKNLVSIWMEPEEVEIMKNGLARMLQPIGKQSLEEFTSHENKVMEVVYKAYRSGMIDFK